MAKDKNKKDKAGEIAKPKMRGGRGGLKRRLSGVMTIVMALLFMPTTILVTVGMLPTIAAALADRSRQKIKTITVGAMNMAGTTFFLLKLWGSEHDTDTAIALISEPANLVIMYGAAAIGYAIDWAMSGIVSTILVQNAELRQRQITKLQEELVVLKQGHIPWRNRGFYSYLPPHALRKLSQFRDPDAAWAYAAKSQFHRSEWWSHPQLFPEVFVLHPQQRQPLRPHHPKHPLVQTLLRPLHPPS
jgi:hypothetical protein